MFQDYIKKHLFKICLAIFILLFLGFYYSFAIYQNIKLKEAPYAIWKPTPTHKSKVVASNAPVPVGMEEPYQEGKQYQKLSAKITTQPIIQHLKAEDPGKIQVLEFFNYACFWCRNVYPEFMNWSENKPENVRFYRYPIVFSKGWEVTAKAFFVVELLDKNKTLDPLFFKAIHQDKIDLTNEQNLDTFVKEHGIDEQKFKELYHSFSVSRSVANSNEIANAYQITASPAIVVNGPSGSYLVTPSMAGGEKAVLDVVKFLLQRESKLMSVNHAPQSSMEVTGAPTNASQTTIQVPQTTTQLPQATTNAPQAPTETPQTSIQVPQAPATTPQAP